MKLRNFIPPIPYSDIEKYSPLISSKLSLKCSKVFSKEYRVSRRDHPIHEQNGSFVSNSDITVKLVTKCSRVGLEASSMRGNSCFVLNFAEDS